MTYKVVRRALYPPGHRCGVALERAIIMYKNVRNTFVGCVLSAIISLSCLVPTTASAYSNQENWEIIRNSQMPNPNTFPYISVHFPSYSGGYILECSSFNGPIGSYIYVNTNINYSCVITEPKRFEIDNYTLNATTTFTFIPYTPSLIRAYGTIGYNA